VEHPELAHVREMQYISRGAGRDAGQVWGHDQGPLDGAGGLRPTGWRVRRSLFARGHGESGAATGYASGRARADQYVQGRLYLAAQHHLNRPLVYVSFIGLRLTKTSLTLINRTRLRTKGQSAGYPQAQIGITSNSFQRRAP